MALYTSNANWLLLCGFRSFVFLDGALAMTKTDGAASAGELLGNHRNTWTVLIIAR
jgi:hypothetical protein